MRWLRWREHWCGDLHDNEEWLPQGIIHLWHVSKYDWYFGPSANDTLNSSTRNCRIECLWVEVGSQFARCWRAFFTHLERIHLLDAQNPTHLWLLHTLFLNDIGHNCHMFWEEWNWHPISSPDTNNKCPKVMLNVVSPLLIWVTHMICAF